MPEEDVDLLRLLWWPNGDLNQRVVEYRMVVHLFGATSSPSCANFAQFKITKSSLASVSSKPSRTAFMLMTFLPHWAQNRKLFACMAT